MNNVYVLCLETNEMRPTPLMAVNNKNQITDMVIQKIINELVGLESYALVLIEYENGIAISTERIYKYNIM